MATASKSAPAKKALESLKADLIHHLSITLGRNDLTVSDRYRSLALAQTIRDRLMVHLTQAAYYDADCRRAYYLSLEFLMGRAMGNAIINLDCLDVIKNATAAGASFEDLIEEEADAGLGNGGLADSPPALWIAAPPCNRR